MVTSALQRTDVEKKPVETLGLVEELKGEGILELWVQGGWSVM